MNIIKFDAELLSLLILVQQYNNFLLAKDKYNTIKKESRIEIEVELLRFLDTFSELSLIKYNLFKDEKSLNKILNFPITKILLETEYNKLSEFKFE